MAISRRRLCSAGAVFALAGFGGCLDGVTDANEPDTGGSNDSDGDDWTWSGTLSVESVVQHHDPDCGCCSRYVDYLESNGLEVVVEPTGDIEAVKRDLGVPDDAASCHTVEFGDYLIEGHVPLEAVAELFDDEPDIDGLAAPGMPRYAPGMGPRGDDPLSIYAFDASGDVFEYTTV